MDRELVNDLIANAPGAWERFVEGYGGLVAAVARRILSSHGHRFSPSDVDDIVANVFAAFLEDDGKLLRRFDPKYKLSTYVAVITRTHAHRFLRKGKGKADLPDELLLALIPDPSVEGGGTRLARMEALQVIRECLDELGERDRKVLRLFYYQGADYGAIAAALGITKNSVGATLTRARERLHRLLSKASDLTESDFRSI